MGEVYRAKDSRLDREVAIKVLPAHTAADTEHRARLEREARAVAARGVQCVRELATRLVPTLAGGAK